MSALASRLPGREGDHETRNAPASESIMTAVNLPSRLAWFHMMDAWPEHTVDHHNGIKSDDRWENLREASHAENAWNRCGSETTYTGIKGVSLFRRRGKPYAWRVSITTNGKRRRSFCHGSLDQAAAVYEQMARELHGEFARTE